MVSPPLEKSAHRRCEKRVHYALGGLVGINKAPLKAPPNARVRVRTEVDVVDGLLRVFGYALTFGAYAGTQSVVVETCGALGAVFPRRRHVPTKGRSVTIEISGAGLGRTERSVRSRTRRRHRRSDQALCRSSIDCGRGKFCRDRGDGVKTCMGDNARGEHCRSSIHCSRDMFCKDPGDGLKVCM